MEDQPSLRAGVLTPPCRSNLGWETRQPRSSTRDYVERLAAKFLSEQEKRAPIQHNRPVDIDPVMLNST